MCPRAPVAVSVDVYSLVQTSGFANTDSAAYEADRFSGPVLIPTGAAGASTGCRNSERSKQIRAEIDVGALDQPLNWGS